MSQITLSVITLRMVKIFKRKIAPFVLIYGSKFKLQIPVTLKIGTSQSSKWLSENIFNKNAFQHCVTPICLVCLILELLASDPGKF